MTAHPRAATGGQRAAALPLVIMLRRDPLVVLEAPRD